MEKAEPAIHLNNSSEEWRHDKYVLPPDEEGGVRVEGEPVQPSHQVQVPHLHISIAILRYVDFDGDDEVVDL